MTWNVLIIGAGAIGCLVGAKLAMAGQGVTLVGRRAFAEQVRSNGLRVTDERGVHVVRNLRPVTSILEAFQRAETAFDLAIATVKSYDTSAAAEELRQALHDTGAPAPLLLSVQNGVGNEEVLAQAAPNAWVIAGSITTPVSVEGPGAIRIDKARYGLGLALWGKATSQESARPGEGETGSSGGAVFGDVCALMEMVGFDVAQFDSAAGMKWTKLLMNMLGNATCAILDEPPQTVFADGRMVDLEISAWREALAVMRAAGIAPVNLEHYPFARLAPLIRVAPMVLIRPVLRKQIGGARGGKLPSLHIDLHGNKGKSEVRWLNGAVVEKASALNVATPVNAALTDTLLHLVDHPDERGGWKAAHERLLQTARGG